MNTDFEKRVAQYVQLRDKIKELDVAHASKMQPFKDMLEQLGNLLLKGLQDNHMDSAKTAAGTCYRSSRSSATVADAEQFRKFVIDNQQWDMVDMRANVNGVLQHIEANRGHLPPGVNFSTVVTVGVRRS